MIHISPAILTNDREQFLHQLENYSKHFEHIDIDINIAGDDFKGQSTEGILFVLEAIQNYKHIEFTIHLMVSDPLPFLQWISAEYSNEAMLTVMVHQEANIDNLAEKSRGLTVGIAVKAESDLKDIEFYKQFYEVQLMTIETGVQGNPFKPEVLKRVEWLRENGYGGIISLDGSVNLESASLIKNYDVDKVSVGSYFSKSKDLIADKLALENALGEHSLSSLSSRE